MTTVYVLFKEDVKPWRVIHIVSFSAVSILTVEFFYFILRQKAAKAKSLYLSLAARLGFRTFLVEWS